MYIQTDATTWNLEALTCHPGYTCVTSVRTRCTTLYIQLPVTAGRQNTAVFSRRQHSLGRPMTQAKILLGFPRCAKLRRHVISLSLSVCLSVCLSVSLSLTHSHTHTHTHARTHARTHTHDLFMPHVLTVESVLKFV